jgi:hypothetical protein
LETGVSLRQLKKTKVCVKEKERRGVYEKTVIIMKMAHTLNFSIRKNGMG